VCHHALTSQLPPFSHKRHTPWPEPAWLASSGTTANSQASWPVYLPATQAHTNDSTCKEGCIQGASSACCKDNARLME